MKIVIYIALFNLLIAFVFWVMWYFTKNKLKLIQHNLDAMVETNHRLMKEIETMRTAEKIKSDNRKEANEKINALHNGDAVDNAINGLSVK